MIVNKKTSQQLVNSATLESSFRDPSGFIFKGVDGFIYRQVNKIAAKDFDLLVKSGLYKNLVDNKLLVAHKNVNDYPLLGEAYKIIKPQQIPFISYPFEWSFSQLKDAALLTLNIQKTALSYNMALKDASAYNVQFIGGRPILIDTLSFERYQADKPWDAYRQYCQHFLAPLLLMANVDLSMNQMSRIFIDGIPLELATKLLPTRVKVKPAVMMHITMHAKAQKAKAGSAKKVEAKLPKKNLLAIIDNLINVTAKLKKPVKASEWGDYYDRNNNYTEVSLKTKAELVNDFFEGLNVKTVIDIGGNNGYFSRYLNKSGIFTVCADIDPNAVEANYLLVKKHQESKMLPLLVDFTNPGGGLGWANKEREIITNRLQCDGVLALAIIHHLAISNNLPLEKIAKYLKDFGKYLVIEFVPKSDSQVKKLLATRKDIFNTYNETDFKKAFGLYYSLIKEQRIKDTERTLFLFKSR
ncbi:SAM-dependent methyltransferase [Candidatus Saccharibacteria bacterium]|nr:SAM-dependent methyltransferase [Candidatus Saccharibacteria bacterium]HOR23611.1 SAM-dependent methyltransferase [Candidatus Saccharibacteria bacterium]